MLVEFTVSNFKSIKEPQTLSMVATNAKEHPDNVFQPSKKENIKLLKTAVVYGPNASGKSNLLEAISCFSSLLQKSANYYTGDLIREYQPFKLNAENIGLPTSFEIEFFGWDDIRYRYSVRFNKKEIIRESLFNYPKKQETKLFIRNIGNSIDYGDSLKGNKKIIENQLLSNQLFLSKAANNNNEQLVNVHHWLAFISRIVDDYNKLIDVTNSLIFMMQEKLSGSVNQMIRNADTGIEQIIVEQAPDNAKGGLFAKVGHKFKSGNKKDVQNVFFDLKEESEGTKKLYGLGGFLLYFLNGASTSVFFIDELNNSLHPLLSEMLIKLFQNIKTNPNNAQLIFTTHDTSLLSPDLFRRDQIWFTEKDQYGATSLYSLAEFDLSKVRANIPFDKWYLNGMFGALPIIQQFNSFPDAEPPKKTKRKAVS